MQKVILINLKKHKMKYNVIIILLILLTAFESNAQGTVDLYTPNGSLVRAELYPEYSAADIAKYTADCAARYPEAEVIGNASQAYNCHSHAWNMVEGGPICWLNSYAYFHKYWEDGSYTETTEANADKIVYYMGDHSAVKSKTHPGMYESKWSSLPLMRHAPGYGPSYFNMSYRIYYKKGNCTTLDFTDLTVNSYTSVKCNNIKAEKIVVKNNTKLVMEAVNETVINGPFEIQSGSELEIK